MAEWITETGIPCFRPHVRRDDEGNLLYEIKAMDLPEIAAKSNRFTIEYHGAKPPLTEGHRDFRPNAKEEDQPLVLGYAENFRVGELPDGTPCILCDRKIMSQYEARAKRHPFPSVDYIHNRRAIVGLAKLTRPPGLNTGAVYYPGTKDAVYVYSMGASMAGEQPPATGQQPAAGAAATPELTPEEQAGSEKVYRYLCQKYAWMGKAAQQYDADLASAANPAPAATATNGAPPKPGEEKPKKKEDEVSTNAANLDLVQKYNATQERLAAVEAEREGEKVDRLLDSLEQVERYQFDRPKERTRMLKLTDTERKERADEIRANHHKLPGGDRIEIYRGNVPPVGGKETTDDTMAKTLAYQQKHKVAYSDALEAVKAGKS